MKRHERVRKPAFYNEHIRYSTQVMTDLLDRSDKKTRSRVGEALQNGWQLSISYTGAVDGMLSTHLDLVNDEGRRITVAAVRHHDSH